MDNLIKKEPSHYIVIENIKTENSIFSSIITQMKAIEFTPKNIPTFLKWLKKLEYYNIPYDIRRKLLISELIKDLINLYIEFIKLYPKNKNLLDREIEQLLDELENTSYQKKDKKINLQDFIVEITKKTTLSEKVIEKIMSMYNFQVELYDFVKSKELLLKYLPFCEKILYKKLPQDKLDEIVNIVLPFGETTKNKYMEQFRFNFNKIIGVLNQHQMKDRFELLTSYIEFNNKVNAKLIYLDLQALLTMKKNMLTIDYNSILDLIMENIGILTKECIIKILEYVPLNNSSIDIQLVIDIFNNKYSFEKFTIQNVDLILKHIYNIELFQLLYTDTYNEQLLKKIIMYNNLYKYPTIKKEQMANMEIFNHCYKLAQVTLEQNKELMNTALHLCKENIVGYLLDNKFPQDQVDLNLLYSDTLVDIIKILEICNKYNIKLNIDSYTHILKMLKNTFPLNTDTVQLKKYTIYEHEADDDKQYLEFIDSVKQNMALHDNIKYLSIQKCLELITNNELNITIADIVVIQNYQTRQFLYDYLKNTNKIKTVKTIKTLKKLTKQ